MVCAISKASDQPAHTRSLIRAFASRLNMTVKLLTEHHLEFLSLKGDCIGSPESIIKCQNATLLEITCHVSQYSFSQNGEYFSKVGPNMLSIWRPICLGKADKQCCN